MRRRLAITLAALGLGAALAATPAAATVSSITDSCTVTGAAPVSRSRLRSP